MGVFIYDNGEDIYIIIHRENNNLVLTKGFLFASDSWKPISVFTLDINEILIQYWVAFDTK